MASPPEYGPEGPIRAVAAQPPVPVAGVLFDFSGTLFQIAPYADRIRAAVPFAVDDTTMDAWLTALATGLTAPGVRAAQHARDTSARAHRHAFTTRYASVPALAPYAAALYEQLRTPEHWLPYADSARTLAALAERGIAVGVVSDVGWDLRPTFAHHGLAEHVGAWVHSFEHRTEKPGPALFRHACALLGLAPAQALMVGDHPAKDGGGALAGLRSYVLPSGAAPGGVRGLDAVLRLVAPDPAV
ncbi:HAD family hydrolase [Streptomyces catenulae]|uniref:HAD family hydrolase n=1 Tax=Streptomyces catenulae TaxID=66875 RepID=A0ABV2Z734_9ACTN|nr:HAD family hydrolase [Streptomyces catenulae]